MANKSKGVKNLLILTLGLAAGAGCIYIVERDGERISYEKEKDNNKKPVPGENFTKQKMKPDSPSGTEAEARPKKQ